MEPVAIVTLIGVALTVAALAIYLITVARILSRVSFTLGTIIAGVTAIANQTEPLGQVMGEINGDLAETRAALEQLLARKTPPQKPAQAAKPAVVKKATGKRGGAVPDQAAVS